MKTRFLACILACLPLASLAAWPDHPIRMVVPYAAGGGADNTARVVAQQMSKDLGQQIIIDNRPGAAGIIGEDNVAKSLPDGYTVLLDASAFSVNPALRKLPFDVYRDFIPVSLVAIAPQLLVVPANAPYKTLAEFLDFARKNPGKLSFASAGAGSASHMAGEALNNQANVSLFHVPYKGGAPALTDLMGGQVSIYFGNAASTLGYVKAGQLRALGIGSTQRIPGLDVPTLAESGLPGFNVIEWNGVLVPAGTPPEVVSRIGHAVEMSVKDPQVSNKLKALGLIPEGGSADEFKKFLKDEIDRVAALVKARHIQAD